MRIGLFTKTYPPIPDGVSYYVSQAKRAMEKEHDVTVFTTRTIFGRYVPAPVAEEENVLRFPAVPYPHYPQYPVPLFPYGRMICEAKKRGLEIVHAHTPFIMGAGAYLVHKHLQVPLVSTFHTNFVEMRGTVGGRITNLFLIDLGWWYTCGLYKRSDVVIAPTRKMADFLRKEGLDNVEVVWDGIDISPFLGGGGRAGSEDGDVWRNFCERTGVPAFDDGDGPLVLFLGRVTRDKGVYVLLDAAAGLHRKHGASFIVAGTGPEEFALREEVKKRGMTGFFFVPGYVSDAEKVALLRRADVFVLPSRAETFGMVLLEAMAAGVPVVAAASGGIVEVVEDGKNGLLVPFGDSEALAEAISSVLSDGRLRSSLVSTGKQFVVERGTIQTSVRRTIEIYESLLRR